MQYEVCSYVYLPIESCMKPNMVSCLDLSRACTCALIVRRGCLYCGGLTPFLLTWMRIAVILPSASTRVAINTYSPGTRNERSAGTVVPIGVPSGTRIFCAPSLYLRVSSRPLAAWAISPTVALVIIEPGSRSQGRSEE